MELSLEDRSRMNGASWYDAAHLPLSIIPRAGQYWTRTFRLRWGIPSSFRPPNHVGKFPNQYGGSLPTVQSTTSTGGSTPRRLASQQYHNIRRQKSDVWGNTKRPGTERANTLTSSNHFLVASTGGLCSQVEMDPLRRKLRGWSRSVAPHRYHTSGSIKRSLFIVICIFLK